MQYRELNANELSIGETQAYSQTKTFDALVSKMCGDKFVLRYIVAPKGFGKMTLCLAYARFIQVEHVFVIDGNEPELIDAAAMEGFIRGLDMQPNSLLVIDDVPYLDEESAHRFSESLDRILEDGIEAIVTVRPSCDVLGELQNDRIQIDAQELLIDVESLAQLQKNAGKNNEAERNLTACRLGMPCVWSMAWKGYEAGVDEILEGIMEEDLASDIRQAMLSMLVLREGEMASLTLPHGCMPPQDLAWLGTSYPFLGLSIASDRFRTIHCSNAQIVRLVSSELKTHDKSSANAWLSGLLSNICDFGSYDVLETLCSESYVKPDVILRMFVDCPWRILDESRTSFLEKLMRWAVAKKCKDASLVLAVGMEVLGSTMPSNGGDGLVTKLRESGTEGPDVKAAASRGFFACLGRTWTSSELVMDRASSGAVEGRESWLAQDFECYEQAQRPGKRRCVRFVWAALKSLELSCSRNDVGVYKVFYPIPAALWPKANHLEILDKMGLVILARTLAVLATRGADGKEIINLLTRIDGLAAHDERRKGKGAKGGARAYSRFDERVATMIGRVKEGASLMRRQREKEPQQSFAPAVDITASLPPAVAVPSQVWTSEPSPLFGGEPEYPTLYIRLFGGFRIYVDGVECESSVLEKRRSRELLVVLALREGRQIPRDDLVRALWSESSMRHGKDSLYSAWSSLRRSLDRIAQTVDAPYLIRGRTGYRINNFLIGTDVHDFKQVARYLLRNVDAMAPQNRKNGAPQTDALLQLFDFADELYNGKVFGGALVDSGSIAIAEQLREMMSEVMLAGASFAASLGLEQRASWFASRAIETGGMREEFYRERMKAQIALGQRSGALDTFFRMQRFLQEQQGVDPSAESTRLYKQVLFDDEDEELKRMQPVLDVEAVDAVANETEEGGEGHLSQGERGQSDDASRQASAEGAPNDNVQSPGAVDAAS